MNYLYRESFGTSFWFQDGNSFLFGLQYWCYHSLQPCRNYRRNTPAPLGTLTQFHGWWHLLAGFGTYLQAVLRYMGMMWCHDDVIMMSDMLSWCNVIESLASTCKKFCKCDQVLVPDFSRGLGTRLIYFQRERVTVLQLQTLICSKNLFFVAFFAINCNIMFIAVVECE